MGNLVLAILASSAIALIMRISGDHVQNKIGMLAANYLCCAAIALGFMGKKQFPLPFGGENSLLFLLALISGGLFVISFLMMQMNTRENGVVLTSTFTKLSVMVPMVMAVTFFHETPTAVQIVGFAVALVAIILIRPAGINGSKGNVLMLLGLLVFSGMPDGMMKILESVCGTEYKDDFFVINFFVAFLLCLILMGVNAVKMRRFVFTKADLFFGLLIGIPNYFSSRFLLLALSSIPATVVYPTYSVATIVLVTLAGVVFFREKLTKKQGVALGLILMALVMLNL